MITFNEAQDIVIATGDVHEAFPDGFTIADYGWQNSSEFLVVVEPEVDGLAMDVPAVYVGKYSGAVRIEYGLLGHAADGMTETR